MRFHSTRLAGAYLIEPEWRHDERGFFGRVWCEREFAAQGLSDCLRQCNMCFNSRKGTLRGMHFQRDPRPDPKLVRCTRGAIYDVIIDLRRGSPTFCEWAAWEITAENRLAVYVPPGFAHGFQTLADDTELLYQMGEFYDPELTGGVRWNDPTFGISWPLANPTLSERDRDCPDFRP